MALSDKAFRKRIAAIDNKIRIARGSMETGWVFGEKAGKARLQTRIDTLQKEKTRLYAAQANSGIFKAERKH